jgi:hypothetical protein
MLTQAMPALAQAMQGVMPQMAVRRMMQALGNCNQPLEHRGPVAIRPTTRTPQNELGLGGGQGGGGSFGPGVYSDGGVWNQNLINQFTDVSQVFNNNSFIDIPTYNNYFNTLNNNFAGDEFLFNTNANYNTNLFPTTIINGVIGSDGINGINGFNGVDGQPGVSGAAGLAGAAGADGAPGVAGPAGAAGAAGLAGAAGAAGAAGPAGAAGVAGLPGIPGLPGLPGIGGGYELRQVDGRFQVNLVQNVTVKAATVSVDVPKYRFDADSCELVPDGVDTVEENVNVQLNIDRGPEVFGQILYTLKPKAGYP